MEIDNLIETIQQAFAGESYPGDDQLTDSQYGEEPAALTEEFRGRTDWRSLDADFLNQAPDGWGSALSFFSAEALRFYLPAYLIADLRGQLYCGDPSSRLCAFLTPMTESKKLAKIHGGGTLGAYARDCFDRFSEAQAAAVVAYLWWKLDQHGYDPTIEQAMENYWLGRTSDN